MGASLLEYELTLDCVHCGLCLPSCPTYQETGRESSSPRGRIYAMRGVAEGRIALDRDVVDEMYLCLACRACESACPAGVQYGRLVESMRAEIDHRGARSRVTRVLQRLVLRRVVADPTVLRVVAGLLRFYQRRGLRRLLRASRLLRAVPSLRRAEGMLPALPDRHRAPRLTPAAEPARGQVGFFAGCLMPELFGPINAATLRVLARNGFDVHAPAGQRCCGALHAHSGDARAASRLHERNARSFETEDVVVVNSAGCGSALRDPGDALSGKVRDVSEFLHDVGLAAAPGRLSLRVAYDDPCHLQHGQRVAAAPRALLRAIPGLELFDLPGAQDCCGAAGIYNLVQPEMSERLLQRKIDAIRRTAPQVVATGNPGCLLQLQRGVREAGLDVEILHPVELLDRAYA
jgi:glycolate oxidase iron-sulfur subunit